MENITLNIIGQRVLADILKEKKNIIKMNILFFENFNDYSKSLKNNSVDNILITHHSNFELIEQFNPKITNTIFYLTNKKKNINIKTKFQKYKLTYYPFNFKNFIEKINLKYMKLKFADNSKINFSNYTINLNSREI